ncbi:MAG: RidA family protein, partial [Acidobacteriota bacterium]|nr:RidA family protein [Acidobacteriota bacterium]
SASTVATVLTVSTSTVSYGLNGLNDLNGLNGRHDLRPRCRQALKGVHPMQLYHTDSAPRAIGPYSQAVSIDGWLYTSGQVGLDPATGEIVPGGFEAQAHRVFENLRHVLAAAGCTFADVAKATVYVTDLADFPRLNTLYGEAMGDHRPARSTVQVAALPRGAMVEIDLVARQRR